MAERSASTRGSDARELVITRVFDAPRDLVWKAWTERDRAIQWWGPKDFTVPLLELDPRPGGAWRAVMRSPEGQEYPQHGVFKEIVPPERLVFTLIWDNDGPGSEMLVTITFVERGGKTEMTFRKGPFTSTEWQKGEEEGWNEAFDRLEAFVKHD
ncbi:MAG: SRPBCC domain-containing protein [Gemmatimonadaceae bacterium]